MLPPTAKPISSESPSFLPELRLFLHLPRCPGLWRAISPIPCSRPHSIFSSGHFPSFFILFFHPLATSCSDTRIWSFRLVLCASLVLKVPGPYRFLRRRPCHCSQQNIFFPLDSSFFHFLPAAVLFFLIPWFPSRSEKRNCSSSIF